MRGILALLVVACCLSNSDATFRLIKAKLNSSPLIQAAIQYLAAPEPLPANYARPSYSSHVSTYSVAIPSIGAGIGVPNPGVGIPSIGAGIGVPNPGVGIPSVGAGIGIPSIGAGIGVPNAGVGIPSVGAGIGVPNPFQGGAYPSYPGVYPELLTAPSPQLQYHGPEVIIQPYAGQFVQEYFNSQYGSHLPLNNYQLGNC